MAMLAYAEEPVVYPDTDGEPMADNTTQFRYIMTIKGGLDILFRDRDDVFVAGDLLWYPVEGRPDIRIAPDVMVAFTRPKGDRSSYLQWKEGGHPPDVVFEIVSPGNRAAELMNKTLFYQARGVQEYFVFDPDTGGLWGWQRAGDLFVQMPDLNGSVSPLLGIRFELHGKELSIYHPNGRKFGTAEEIAEEAEQERERAEQERERAEQERERAEQERERADQERERAEQERERADQERERADQEHVEATKAREEVQRLAAQLRALGIDPHD